MKYLCIETTGNSGFVTLFSNQKKEFEYSWKSALHSEQVTDSLKLLIPHLKPGKIKFIAVDVGPGRFTGVRAGVNFAKTLSYYLKSSIYPCCSLRMMAEPYLKGNNKPVLCLMEAFGQMFYTSLYQKSHNQVQTLIPPLALSLSQLEEKIKQPFIGVGDIFEKPFFSLSSLKKFLDPIEKSFISSKTFSKVVLSEWNEKKFKSWFEIEPCYLRVPGVIKKPNEQRKRI